MGEGVLTTEVDRRPGIERSGSVPRQRPRRRRAGWPRLWNFLTFGAPGLLVYVCFVLAPILVSVGYSLTNYNPFRPPTRFVGLRNYRLLFEDPEFLNALRVTTILTLIVVIVPNVFGLLIALLLDRRGWFYNALRSVFFVPVVLSSVVVSIIWTRMMVYLAGLQGVPKDLLEAAAIDGAGPWQRFRKVTWPLLAPALTINTVVQLISAFKVFDHIQVITNGGPGEGTTASIAFTVLQVGFTANRQGYASAMAIAMLVIIAVASALALKLLQRREVDL